METIAQSFNKYADGYYNTKLQEGLKFQDTITHVLYQIGIVIVGYASKHYQNNCGENMLGAEIKRDGRFRETGNLYIEIAEKSHPSNPNYVSSGIKRNDSWLWIIGDEKTIWIFPIKYLLWIAPKFKEITTPTSKGFLMPIADADKYAIRKLEF